MTPPASPALEPPSDGAEGERAELYGLLAALWLSAPQASLWAQLQSAAQASVPAAVSSAPAESLLAAPWQALLVSVREMSLGAASDEYDALFAGVGKPEVFLYGSFYLSGFLNEKPLASLRTDLQALGLARDPDRLETEDHIAYGFEVMRYLIAGEDAAVCNLEQQRRFFRGHLQPWVDDLCASTQAHPRAHLWSSIASLTAAFMAVETQGFDLLEQ